MGSDYVRYQREWSLILHNHGMKIAIAMLVSLLAVICVAIMGCSVESDGADVYQIDNGSCGTNLKWSYYNNGMLLIYGNGDMKDYPDATSAPWSKYDIRTLQFTESDNKSITHIGKHAFEGQSRLSAVNIPDFASVGDYAFKDCTNLSVANSVVSGSEKGASSIGNYAFENCTSLHVISVLGPNTTEVGYGIFKGCTSLEVINLPKGVTEYKSMAQGCTSLACFNVDVDNEAFCAVDGVLFSKDMTTMYQFPQGRNGVYHVPETVTNIMAAFMDSAVEEVIIQGDVKSLNKSFSNCPNLVAVSLPDSITTIKDDTFSNCHSLRYVNIGESVTSIGVGAFSNCTSLTTIHIPASVTMLGFPPYSGTNILDGCTSLTSITVSGDNPNFKSIDGVLYSKNGKELLQYPIGRTDTEYTLEEGVNAIGYGAFAHSPYLVNINLDAVTSIEDRAFESCAVLESVSMRSVGMIGWNAFDGCVNLRNVTIPISFYNPGKYNGEAYGKENLIFRNTGKVETITFTPGTGTGCNYTESTCINTLQYLNRTTLRTIVLEEGIVSLGQHLLDGCNNVNTLTLPSTLNTVDLTIPDVIPNIEIADGNENLIFENGVLYNSDKTILFWTDRICGDVILPETLTSINEGAFNGRSFNSLVIPDGLNIGSVSNCKVRNLTIPIKYYSVTGFSEIQLLTLTSTNSSYSATGASNTLAKSNSGTLREAIVGEGVTSLPENMFYGCRLLKQVTLPSTLQNIGNYAFYGTSIGSITLPESLTSLPSQTFSNCYHLYEIVCKSSSVSPSNLYNDVSVIKSENSSIVRVTEDGFIYLAMNTPVLVGRISSDPTMVLPLKIEEKDYRIRPYAFKYDLSIENLTIPAGFTSKLSTGCFEYCQNLRTLNTPANVDLVVSNGSPAFYGCTNITKVMLLESNTTYIYYVDNANYPNYDKTPWYLSRDNLREIVVSDGVKAIGSVYFQGCRNVSAIIIPDSVTTIGMMAFYGCTGLKTVNLGRGVTSIGTDAFGNCTNIVEVYYKCNLSITKGSDTNGQVAYYAKVVTNGRDGAEPSTVTTEDGFQYCTVGNRKLIIRYVGDSEVVTIPGGYDVAAYAFSGCSSVKKLIISGSVGMEDNSFRGLSLTEMEIPWSLRVRTNMAEVFAYTSIEKVTVTGASNLPDSIFDYSESDWYSKTLWYVTKAKVVELREGNHIDPYMFKNCSDLQTVILAPSMGTIESYAFYGCNRLKTIDLSNVSSIGVYAFAHSGVKTIVLSGSMGQLKDSVFENCTSLVNVTLPESLTAIGQRTFYGCVRLDAISIPKSVMSIGTDAFKGCNGLRQLTVQDGYYADRFKDSVDIEILHTPIDDPFPSFAMSLKELYLYPGTTGKGVDYNSVLTFMKSNRGSINITVCEGVTYIGNNSFREGNIASLTLPSTLTEIGNYAFSDSSLNEVVIPESVSKIGDGAFSNCKNLYKVTMPISAKHTCGWNSPNSFYNDKKILFLIITPGSGYGGFYRTNDHNTYLGSAEHVIFTEGVKVIPDYMFKECSVKVVDLPDSLETIGLESFRGCHLTTITLPQSLTRIDPFAFKDCTDLKNVFNASFIPISPDGSSFGSVAEYALSVNGRVLDYDNGEATGKCNTYTKACTVESMNVTGEVINLAYVVVHSIGYRVVSISDRALESVALMSSDGSTPMDASQVMGKIFIKDGSGNYVYTEDALLFDTRGGSTVSPIIVPPGETFVISSDPVRNGFTFGGWYADAGCYEAFSSTVMSEGYSTVFAKWIPIVYTITYELNGGINQYNPSIYMTGSKNIDLEPAVKEHYSFDGWYLNGTAYTKYIDAERYGDITLVARWEPIEYWISFDMGETRQSIRYTADNMEIVEPDVPEKVGKTGKWEDYELMFDNSQVVRAVYTLIDYKVTFNDGTVVTERIYTIEDASVSEPVITDRQYYSAVWEDYVLDMADGKVVNAVYTPITYTITFDDGTNSTTVEYTVETQVIKEPKVTKITGQSGDWNEYQREYTMDQIVNATYVVGVYRISFISDGSIVETYKRAYGLVIELPESPNKGPDVQYSYHFSHWEGYTEGMTVGDDDMEFTAVFSKVINNYNVTFTVEGAKSTSVLEYGALITVPQDPSKNPTLESVYTFREWIGYTAGMTVRGNIEFVAAFDESPHPYQIRFLNDDGSSISESMIGYGLPINPPQAHKTSTTKFDYEFNRWTDSDGNEFVVPSTVGGDLTAYASYTANLRKYTVTFAVDGNEYSRVELFYGDNVTVPVEDPSKASDSDFDYTFARWSGYSTGMVVLGPSVFEAVFSKTVVLNMNDSREYVIDIGDDSATFSDDAIDTIIEQARSDPAVTMSVSLGDGIITFDNDALQTLGNGRSDLSLTRLEKSQVSSEIKDIVGDNVAISITFGNNSDFGNGKVTVTVPYVLESGKNPDQLTIYYISEGKVAEEIPCQYIDGYVKFETNHFSTYAIMYIGSEEADPDNPGTSMMLLVLGGGGLLLLVAVAGSYLFIRRRN